MNVLTFTGNLGRDAEVKYTQSGTAICSFSVAIKSGYGDKERTTWVQCALFGKRAEGGLPQYLTKGAQVCISGEMSLNEWTNQDGGKGAAVQCVVHALDLIGGKPQGQQPAQQPQNHASAGFQAPQQPAPQSQNPPVAGFDSSFDDELPPF